MKPSPQGRFPKAPGSVSSPASGIASRPERSRRRSVPFESVMWASDAASSALRDRVALAAQPLHVGAHHPREHLLGHAGQRRAPRPVLAGALAGGRVRERLDGRRQHHVGGCHRLRDRPRRLRGVRGPLGDHRQDRLRPSVRRLLAEALRQACCVAGLQTTRASSPSLTPRQSRTTACTARSRSLIGRGP